MESAGEAGVLYVAMGTLATLGHAPTSILPKNTRIFNIFAYRAGLCIPLYLLRNAAQMVAIVHFDDLLGHWLFGFLTVQA